MSDQQQIRLSGELADTFLIQHFSGAEELGRLFDFTVDLLATQDDLAFPDLLGGRLTVCLELIDGQRYFDGCITAFSQIGWEGRRARYRARIRPWLWYLTRTRDCRIFQNQSVPEVLAALFQEHGYSDFEDTLTADYPQHEYCVQYRESDFDFISRLMEEEGIYYFFRHEDGKHTLVLADAPSCHERIPGCEEARFLPPGSGSDFSGDHLWEWWLSREIQTELYALRDYDFENPRNPPEEKESRPQEHQADSLEAYDYPGRFVDAGRGRHLATVRVEECQSAFERVEARGNLRAVAVGGLFELSGHPRQDQNREYLVVRTTFKASAPNYEAGVERTELSFESRCLVISSETPFRTERLTPRPVVQGPQTATVVGPSGETVWTDEYGRVKCQFHWDREGGRDENSSCWVRVSQLSAGSGWGAVFMPHIGHEVIVSFLEGDPDRPIVVGRVYNADNMPPFALPDHQYRSVIRDHYGNEILMDGTPGNERISIYTPSHRSEMIIGKSFQRKTESDDWEKTVGNGFKITMGNSLGLGVGHSMKFAFGAKFDFFGGASGSVKMGLDASVAATTKLGVTLGPDVSYSAVTKVSAGPTQDLGTTGKLLRRHAGEQMILEAGREVLLGGGASTSTRTLLSSSNTGMSLAFGTPAPAPDPNDKGAQRLLAGLTVGFATATIASLVGGVTHMQASLNADAETHDNANRDDGDDQAMTSSGREIPGMAIGYGTAALVSAAAAGASMAGWLKSFKAKPAPSLQTETSRIELKDKRLQLWAGTGRKTEILMDDKDINIEAEKDVNISTKGDVNFNKLVVLGKNAGVMKVKAKIDHKNLKVT